MNTRTFTAYIVGQTEKARAVLLTIDAADNSPWYVPVSKTVSFEETDGLDKPARVKGVTRKAIPCVIEVDADFCEKTGH